LVLVPNGPPVIVSVAPLAAVTTIVKLPARAWLDASPKSTINARPGVNCLRNLVILVTPSPFLEEHQPVEKLRSRSVGAHIVERRLTSQAAF
jgi:hypothetical protein